MSEPKAPERYACRACGAAEACVFFEMRGVPTLVNFLHATRKSAVECPRGDILLGYCARCGLMSNVAFDASKLAYGNSYENPLHHSELFRTYAAALAEALVERFDLRGKSIVEIGCGDGSFLRSLCRRGGNRGVGFDPSFRATHGDGDDAVDIVQDYYSEKYADVRADFVVSRHTLEHVEYPGAFLGAIRRSIGERIGTPLFIEVPNASYMLRNRFVWDIIYEHVSYFTARSLSIALGRACFRAERIYEAFSDQYLCAEARAVESGGSRVENEEPSARAAALEPDISGFVSGYGAYLRDWEGRLRELRASGCRVALWGAGSKGVTFLNTFDTRDVIELVVDINPEKHGMFIAGSGQRIVAPEALVGAPPRTVLVANPVYREEVERSLATLGVAADVITL